MGKSFKDLLSGDFITPEQALPVDILGELKQALAEKVNYRLEFDIFSTTVSDRVTHNFRVTVGSLGNYTAELFKISHKVLDLYPVRISGATPAPTEAADENELREMCM